MFGNRKSLRLIVTAIFGAVLLSSSWAYAQGGLAKITAVKLTDNGNKGCIVTELDGDTPIGPQYSENCTGSLSPMYRATAVYISPAKLELEGLIVEGVPDPGQKVVSATFGAAWNVWVTWGGTRFWVAP